jgi:hypothetical protein
VILFSRQPDVAVQSPGSPVGRDPDTQVFADPPHGEEIEHHAVGPILVGDRGVKVELRADGDEVFVERVDLVNGSLLGGQSPVQFTDHLI